MTPKQLGPLRELEEDTFAMNLIGPNLVGAVTNWPFVDVHWDRRSLQELQLE